RRRAEGRQQPRIACFRHRSDRRHARDIRGRTASGSCASLLTIRTGFDGKAGRSPFGKALDEPAGAAAVRTKDLAGTVGGYAVRSAAVRDVLLVFRKLTEPALKIADRNGEGAHDMTRCVLVGGSRVEHDDLRRSRSS